MSYIGLTSHTSSDKAEVGSLALVLARLSLMKTFDDLEVDSADLSASLDAFAAVIRSASLTCLPSCKSDRTQISLAVTIIVVDAKIHWNSTWLIQSAMVPPTRSSSSIIELKSGIASSSLLVGTTGCCPACLDAADSGAKSDRAVLGISVDGV